MGNVISVGHPGEAAAQKNKTQLEAKLEELSKELQEIIVPKTLELLTKYLSNLAYEKQEITRVLSSDSSFKTKLLELPKTLFEHLDPTTMEKMDGWQAAIDNGLAAIYEELRNNLGDPIEDLEPEEPESLDEMDDNDPDSLTEDLESEESAEPEDLDKMDDRPATRQTNDNFGIIFKACLRPYRQILEDFFDKDLKLPPLSQKEDSAPNP